MEIRYTVGAYNDRRYSKPWIAKIVSWPAGKSPVLEFGASLDARTAVLDAGIGDVVKVGQKDYRNSRGTENYFAIIQTDGTLSICSAIDARNAWIARDLIVDAPAVVSSAVDYSI